MFVHRVKEVRRLWESSSRPPHEHQPDTEETVNGYKTGRLICTVCGDTLGTTDEQGQNGSHETD